jgi:hypothetical protein
MKTVEDLDNSVRTLEVWINYMTEFNWDYYLPY